MSQVKTKSILPLGFIRKEGTEFREIKMRKKQETKLSDECRLHISASK